MEIRYNTKIKTYPDGVQMVTYCKSSLFVQHHHLPTDDDLQIQEEDLLPIQEEEGAEKKGISSELNRIRAMIRARNRIFDIVFMNRGLWSHFLTITYNDQILNGACLPDVMEKTSIWLENQTSRKGLNYILVPEYHKKYNRVHCHCLINDVFPMIDSGTRICEGNLRKPMRIETIQRLGLQDKIKSVVYNVPDWKYGFSTAIPVYGNGRALAAYITKYVTKECEKIFGKYYWSCEKLTRDPEITYTNTDFNTINSEIYTVPNTKIELKYEVRGGEFAQY